MPAQRFSRSSPTEREPAVPARSAETATPASFVLGLQRTAGNHAVTEAIAQGRLARDFTPAPAPGVSPPSPPPPPTPPVPETEGAGTGSGARACPAAAPATPEAAAPTPAAPRTTSKGDSKQLTEEQLTADGRDVAKWQQFYTDRDVKARSFGAVDYDDYVANMLVGGGSVMGRAVPAGHPVHPLFLERLEAATAKAKAALGTQPFDVGPFGGQDNRPGNHAYGIAIDIVSDANPYVMNEKGEGAIDAATAPVYERIATTMLGRPTVITPHKGKDDPTGLQTASYEQIAEENDAMVAYFSVLKKPEDPDAPPPPKNAPKPLPAPKAMSGRTFAPEVLAALDVKQVQADYDLLLGRGQKPKKGTDFPFVRGGPGLERDPARGFLTIRKEVVDAFRGEGLRWGATDFQGASGDVMHFDDGNRHADYEKYGREHPTAKRQAGGATAPARPSPGRWRAPCSPARSPPPSPRSTRATAPPPSCGRSASGSSASGRTCT